MNDAQRAAADKVAKEWSLTGRRLEFFLILAGITCAFENEGWKKANELRQGADLSEAAKSELYCALNLFEYELHQLGSPEIIENGDAS